MLWITSGFIVNKFISAIILDEIDSGKIIIEVESINFGTEFFSSKSMLPFAK